MTVIVCRLCEEVNGKRQNDFISEAVKNGTNQAELMQESLHMTTKVKRLAASDDDMVITQPDGRIRSLFVEEKAGKRKAISS